MMKKFFLPILTAIAATLGACTDIGEDERFIPVEGVTQRRAVLLEEFTGQNCPNCPSAHKEIETLLTQYPDALIPVSIHAGDFGISCTARRPGLMQPEGDAYNDRYGIDEWPKGVVNGRGGARNFDEWSDAVRDELSRDTPLGIELSATIATASPTTIAVDCTLQPATDLTGTLYVWVLEDGIVARQVDRELGVISDYVHNHVYRATVNGVDGENTTLTAHVHKSLAYTVEIRDTEKEKWVPENLSVVAFVRATDGSVTQAAKCHVSTITE